MTEHSQPVAVPTDESDFRIGQNMPRFNHEFQKASGSREMVEDPEGEWVKLEDIRIWVMPYIDGYLMEHCHMLREQRVHPTVVEAIEKLRQEMGKL